MNNATRFILFALAFNVIVLVPVVTALLFDSSHAEQSVGPVTNGRLILTSIYMAIAIVSAGSIAMHLNRLAWAVPMSVGLFSVEVIYKLITVPIVGISNPVVITNLVVVVVQLVALFVLWNSMQKRVANA